MRDSTYERVISQIEHRPQGHLVDLGMILLGLGGAGAKRFGSAVDYVIERSRTNGESDVSLDDEEESGITIHANHRPFIEGLQRLEVHAEIKKYRHKKRSWFGLAIRPGDGSLLYGVTLDYEWHPDERLEEASRTFPASRPTEFVGGKPRHQKIGRNALCPCGSKKKYKKCHIR